MRIYGSGHSACRCASGIELGGERLVATKPWPSLPKGATSPRLKNYTREECVLAIHACARAHGKAEAPHLSSDVFRHWIRDEHRRTKARGARAWNEMRLPGCGVVQGRFKTWAFAIAAWTAWRETGEVPRRRRWSGGRGGRPNALAI